MIEQDGAISPENTLFVLLCFEGPDVTRPREVWGSASANSVKH